jgi:hypothetical protein
MASKFWKGLGQFFGGKPDRLKRISNYIPEQEQGLRGIYNNPIQNQPLYQQGQSFLGNILGGGQGAFDAFQAPQLRQLREQILPQIANQYAGMGTGAGGLNSSAFINSANQAGARTQENLAAQQAGLQFQAAGQALPYAQQPYQNQLAGLGAQPFTNTYQPGTSGFATPLFAGIGAGFGGGAGLAAGSALGNMLFNKGSQGSSTGFNPGLGFSAGPAMGMQSGIGY